MHDKIVIAALNFLSTIYIGNTLIMFGDLELMII